MSGQIFISYRREESRWSARSLHDRLCRDFDPEQIFMDIDAIALGEDFVKAIETTVAKCDVLIAVIGNNWLTSKDDHGDRRLDNSEDFVRMEIGAALKREISVIPVLVDGALMPRATDLPEDLKSLVRRNALRITDTSFDGDCQRLAAAIRLVLEKAAAVEKEHLAATSLPPAQFEADKPSAETPKVVHPLPPKPRESEHEKPPPPASGVTPGKSPPMQAIVFFAIAAVLVVAGLMYLAIRPKSSAPQPAPASPSPSLTVPVSPTPVTTPSPPEAVARPSSSIRVFASGDPQLEFLKKNFSKLSSAGVTADLRERPLNDDTRPKTNEIRYFHHEDRQEALRIAQAVKDAFGVGLPDVKLYNDDSAPNRYIEIWIARIP
jgi:hypothetical protein